MAGSMEGIHVVELGFWVARLSVGGVLSRLGSLGHQDQADRLFAKGFGVDMPVNPPLELERVTEDRW